MIGLSGATYPKINSDGIRIAVVYDQPHSGRHRADIIDAKVVPVISSVQHTSSPEAIQDGGREDHTPVTGFRH